MIPSGKEAGQCEGDEQRACHAEPSVTARVGRTAMIRAIMPEAAAGEFEPARTVASAVGLARLVPAGGAPTEQKRTEENGEGTHRDQWSLNSCEIPRGCDPIQSGCDAGAGMIAHDAVRGRRPRLPGTRGSREEDDHEPLRREDHRSVWRRVRALA
jgi:hypothetical protein